MFRILLCAFFVLALSEAYIQELTLYSGPKETRNAVIIRTKIPDLSVVLKPLISEVKSYCYKGLWAFYGYKNFDGSVFGGLVDNRTCVNVESSPWPVASVRFLGPEDTDIESLSVYESRDYFKREVVITETAANLPLFPPGALVATNGHSRLARWTFFSEPDFKGDSICYVTEQRNEQVNVLKTVFPDGIKSVTKGCNERVLEYVNAKSLETQ